MDLQREELIPVFYFRYVGLDIEQTAEGIIVRQEHYIDEVEEIMLFDKRNRNSDESLSTEESRKLKVYEEIKDQGQKVISTRWVITEKICEGQKGAKARLVARGFEDE